MNGALLPRLLLYPLLFLRVESSRFTVGPFPLNRELDGPNRLKRINTHTHAHKSKEAENEQEEEEEAVVREFK